MFVSFGCAVVHVQKLTLAIFCIPYAKYNRVFELFDEYSFLASPVVFKFRFHVQCWHWTVIELYM